MIQQFARSRNVEGEEKAARRRDEWFSPFPFRRWLAILNAPLNDERVYCAIAVNSFGFIKARVERRSQI